MSGEVQVVRTAFWRTLVLTLTQTRNPNEVLCHQRSFTHLPDLLPKPFAYYWIRTGSGPDYTVAENKVSGIAQRQLLLRRRQRRQLRRYSWRYRGSPADSSPLDSLRPPGRWGPRRPRRPRWPLACRSALATLRARAPCCCATMRATAMSRLVRRDSPRYCSSKCLGGGGCGCLSSWRGCWRHVPRYASKF